MRFEQDHALMPKRSTYNDAQLKIIWDTAERVFNKDFRQSKKAQINFGLALGLSQQSVSKILNRDPAYRPGPKYVLQLAMLDGKSSVKELIGDYDVSKKKIKKGVEHESAFKNLEICLSFHVSTKHWSPWTVAAARAGFFGTVDFPAPDWSSRLDQLEKILERGRKVA